MKKADKPVDQLAMVSSELRSGEWLAHAQRRSSRRKSAWNLLLLPLFAIPLCVTLMSVWLKLAAMAFDAFHPLHVSTFSHLRGPLMALVVFPIFVSSLLCSMIGANFLAYRIPAARRAMDQEDSTCPGVAYASSQRALIKVVTYVFSVGLVLVLLTLWLA